MKLIFLLMIIIALIIIYFLCDAKYETYTNFKSKIPKVIISTYHTKSKIPKKVYKNIKKYAPDYKHLIFDDNDIIYFMKKYYPKEVLDIFHKLKRGAHKADLFRYCYLYKFGGVYLDIKTELIENINKTFSKNNIHLYTVLSKHKHTIYQGIIASTPKNPIFKKLINYIINIDKPIKRYLVFTYDFYKKLQESCYGKVKRGYNKGSYGNFYLFQEYCSKNPGECSDGLDRYKYCCFVKDGNKKVIKTRYSDYPW